jgi:DNA-binding NarL/FixJ family response regulator
VLRDAGYRVTLAASYDSAIHAPPGAAGLPWDLVIATNTSLQPDRIRSIVPEIKARHPRVRIVVLSGHYPADYVASLTHNGIDGFLTLPFKKDVLLKEVARQLGRNAVIDAHRVEM